MNVEISLPIVQAICKFCYIPCGAAGLENITRFCGNQWNENWEWDEEALAKLPDSKLQAIFNTFNTLNGSRNVNGAKT